MRTLRPAAPLLLLLGLFAGCAKVPVTHYYDLAGAATPPGPASREAGPWIGVRELVVEPPYDQDRLVYRVGDESPEVGFYAYHRWAAPLSRMLASVIARELDGAPGTGGVELAQPGRDYDAVLGGRLETFEEVDIDGVPHVRLELTLHVDAHDGASRWERRLAGGRAVPTTEVSDLVQAIRTILSEELAAVREELADALR